VLLKRRREDAWREYPADGLTPNRLVAIFREADAGSLSAQMALFEQMEEKDAHLFSVANTRRLAVTGLPWEIVSAAQMPGWGAARSVARSVAGERGLADAAAAFCDAALRSLPGFEESLAHLSLAVGRNIALVELVWEATAAGLQLAALQPVDFGRLAVGDFGEVRILTDEAKFDGVPLPPDKFIVHAPHAASGHPLRGGLLRVTALAYLAKHFAIKDWLIFAEVFGMPVRIARYAPHATPEEKRELLEMLKSLGADATGVFSKAVELEIIQSRTPGEVNLYENLCLYFDREISKAWLGQTLTTDTARMLASAGAAKVHDQVRRDLRDDDLAKEARTIRRDLLGPMVRMQFGADAPVPHFRRIVDQRFEPEKLARVLDVAVNQLGARVPARWVHATLGIPEAGGEEAVLPGGDGKRDG
jgi:phage gp29-like protein